MRKVHKQNRKRGKIMYGLNDKNSKNYIADQAKRSNLLRILITQSKVLNVTPEEILQIINK